MVSFFEYSFLSLGVMVASISAVPLSPGVFCSLLVNLLLLQSQVNNYLYELFLLQITL